MSVWSHMWSRNDRPDDKSFKHWEYTQVDIATAWSWTDNLRLTVGPGDQWGTSTELTPADVRNLRDALNVYLARLDGGHDR